MKPYILELSDYHETEDHIVPDQKIRCIELVPEQYGYYSETGGQYFALVYQGKRPKKSVIEKLFAAKLKNSEYYKPVEVTVTLTISVVISDMDDSKDTAEHIENAVADLINDSDYNSSSVRVDRSEARYLPSNELD